MSKKGFEILMNLWHKVDQAPYDMMVADAFEAVPTATQKSFVERLLDNDNWDRDHPSDEDLQEAYKFIGKDVAEPSESPQ